MQLCVASVAPQSVHNLRDEAAALSLGEATSSTDTFSMEGTLQQGHYCPYAAGNSTRSRRQAVSCTLMQRSSSMSEESAVHYLKRLQPAHFDPDRAIVPIVEHADGHLKIDPIQVLRNPAAALATCSHVAAYGMQSVAFIAEFLAAAFLRRCDGGDNAEFTSTVCSRAGSDEGPSSAVSMDDTPASWSSRHVCASASSSGEHVTASVTPPSPARGKLWS